MSGNSIHALEARWYSDPAIYAREVEAIFGREWLLIGHESEMPNAGDYIAAELVGKPIFVIRAKDGSLKGFHNVCRHRAGILVEDGTGHCGAIRCRYHGWLYDTDGMLRKRPGFAEEDSFDRAELSLFPIGAAAWRGFVFVNFSSSPVELASSLGGLVDALKPFPLERYEFHRRQVYDLGFNWKNYTDNYLEGYHITYMHKGLAADLDMSTYRVENGDRVSIHRSEPRGGGGAYEGLFMWRWPNNTVGVYGSGFNVCRILPTGPRGLRLVFDFFFDRATALDQERKDKACDTTCAVVEEDFSMCSAVQRNLEAGLYRSGPLSPRHEGGLAYFHSLVRSAVGS